MIRNYTLALFIGLLFLSCNKTEEKIIGDNNPPADNTIPASLRINFINKVYISLIGREPETAEFNAADLTLRNSNFSSASRKTIVQEILNQDAFLDREFEIYRNDLMSGVDTAEISELITTFEFLLTNSTYMQQWPLIEIEKARLISLRNVGSELKNGTISLIEMQRRCVDNFYFDQLNMGSLNFVIACFQNLLLRNPTQFEQTEGVKMLDGFNGILFLQTGESKAQFQQIFFQSDDYFAGQIKLNYLRFMLRLPSSEEEVFYSSRLKSDGNIKTILIDLLSSDEYAGI
jgi:hypothetical protein